jgi:hypothetical protein
MRRREFIWIFGGAVVTGTIGCTPDANAPGTDAATSTAADAPQPPDMSPATDACVSDVVKMHDTYAQALYFDGSNGPLTGIITVAHAVAGSTLTLEFWHGHGGVQHQFTLEPMHFAALRRRERVTLDTTVVDNHSHTLFVDPTDEMYRVPGAPDVDVRVGCA